MSGKQKIGDLIMTRSITANTNSIDIVNAKQKVSEFTNIFSQLEQQIQRVYVGQEEVVRLLLAALFCNGHVLLEGMPGLGKTLLAHTLARAVEVDFSRIQFTPDMMPSDITGTNTLHENSTGNLEVKLEPGPLVANFVLADEINRATPKTQSALLQAMQEHQITIGKETIVMPEPYMVIATQNPVEQEGTYPLPEAQLDRFMVKLLVGYPNEEQTLRILTQTTSNHEVNVQTVCSSDDVLRMRKVVREVAISDNVSRYAVRLTLATHPDNHIATHMVKDYVEAGVSPRAAQSLILLSKVIALLDGRYCVSIDDIKTVALSVLRHRIMLRYEAMAVDVSADKIINSILESLSELTDEL